MAELNLDGSVNEMAVDSAGSIYVAAGTTTGDGRRQCVVARLRTPLEIHNATTTAAKPVPLWTMPATTPYNAAPAGPAATATTAEPAPEDRLPAAGSSPPAPARNSAKSGHATVPQQRPAPHDRGLGWPVSRPDRGNPAGEYVAFGAWSGLYWVAVGINVLLIAVLAIVLFNTSPVTKVLVGVVEAFLIFVTIGFGKMATTPIRLEVGTHGIQVFARSGTSWFPWQVVDRVEVMRLEGSNLHVVAWCRGANTFPEFDGYGGGPRFVPRLGAVAVCPVSILRARRHLIVRALHAYGGNRIGTL